MAKRIKLIVATSIVIIIGSITFTHIYKNDSVRDPVYYIGTGQSLVEWNGQKYSPLGSSAEYRYLKRGKNLGRVEGIDGLRAYAVKNDNNKEYLIISTEGLMREQAVYKLILKNKTAYCN